MAGTRIDGPTALSVTPFRRTVQEPLSPGAARFGGGACKASEVQGKRGAVIPAKGDVQSSGRSAETSTLARQGAFTQNQPELKSFTFPQNAKAYVTFVAQRSDGVS